MKIINIDKLQNFLEEMANSARENGYPESVETIQSVQDHLLQFEEEYDERITESLEFEIKGLRKKASFIEHRNPDGSLNEITNDMKVIALKLETRVLEQIKSKFNK